MEHIGSSPDDIFAQHLAKMGGISAEQLAAARALQAANGVSTPPPPLAEVLVHQGVITGAIRENIERRIRNVKLGGHEKLGDYRLIRKLGQGGMGAVYLAEHIGNGEKVALKVLLEKNSSDPELITRFKREARATSALHHENIVSATEAGEEAGTYYYVMEFCEGESLFERLLKSGMLPWKEALEIVLQVSRGLQCAHENHFIHRDIKPSNIFITKTGCVKILDLGLTKNITDTGQSGYNTMTGVTLGTPHYISPEQAQGRKDIDGRSDIYSLGATLYQLVTGRTPFVGFSADLVIAKHVREELPNPQDINEEIPDDLVQVIRKMMAKNPNDRYENCTGLIVDVECLLTGKPPHITVVLGAGRSSVGLRAKSQTDLSRAAGQESGAFIPLPSSSPASVAVPTPFHSSGLLGTFTETKTFQRIKTLYVGHPKTTIGISAGFVSVVAMIFLLSGRHPAQDNAAAIAANFKKPAVELVIDREWTKKAQALKGKERVDEVLRKLKELNPNFDVAKWTYAFDSEGNEIISVQFAPKSGVTDVSPVLAFSQLEGLAFDFDPIRDKSFLREFTKLKQVNGLTMEEILKRDTPMPSTYIPPPQVVQPEPVLKYDDVWTKATLALPPDKKPLAVSVQLHKLNPKFDMNSWQYTMDASGEVNTAAFKPNSRAEDLTPLIALPKLSELAIDYDPHRDKLLLKEMKMLKKVNGVELETVLKNDVKMESTGNLGPVTK